VATGATLNINGGDRRGSDDQRNGGARDQRQLLGGAGTASAARSALRANHRRRDRWRQRATSSAVASISARVGGTTALTTLTSAAGTTLTARRVDHGAQTSTASDNRQWRRRCTNGGGSVTQLVR
jgi:hypothetical protein